MELFEIRNNRALPSVHALMIEPYKTIWEEDTSADKSEAIKIFSYAELLCNPRKSNPFIGYSETERPGKVRKEVWGDENYTPEDVMKIIKVVEAYRLDLERSSESYSYWLSAKKAYDKVKDFLDNFDPNLRTNSGSAVYKISEIDKSIAAGPNTIKSLEKLRNQIVVELDESKTRKDRVPGPFED